MHLLILGMKIPMLPLITDNNAQTYTIFLAKENVREAYSSFIIHMS